MEIKQLDNQIAELLRQHAIKLATAESCTGGLISHRITNLPGSSDYFIGGVIAYSNQVKQRLLNVEIKTLQEHGAVSEQTVIQMAIGIRNLLDADIGLSVSGIAGPAGGTEDKPVGTIWIGLSVSEATTAWKHIFPGNRFQIKERTAEQALIHLVNYLQII